MSVALLFTLAWAATVGRLLPHGGAMHSAITGPCPSRKTSLILELILCTLYVTKRKLNISAKNI
jgi:hypothetical protein